jgi:hypothetical protein
MGQADEIRALARAVAAAGGPQNAPQLAEAILSAADAQAWEAEVGRWLSALRANERAFARAVLGIDVVPELTEIARRYLLEPGGVREALPLGPVSLSLEAAPAVTSRGAAVHQLGLLPASGLGVSLDAGFLRGFGGAARDGPRYLASLGARLGTVAVHAFVVLERPQAGPTSVLALLGARFNPGVQVGFGFQITGVGGLVGVNRRADPDELRARLTSGAAIDAMFPDDPRGRAPELLRALAAFFPAQPGSFVVGPTFQLAWVKIEGADLFTVDLGVVIELPGPTRVIVVGSARAQLGPREAPLLYLRIDVLGVLDFQRSLFSLDAALVDSHAFGIFRVTGSAAARISWGARPYGLLSIGGFFPGFNPEPAQIPPVDRLALTLENPIGGVYLRAEGYLAVTSNTVQFGGRLETGLEAAGLRAGGFIGLDALVQFSPFWFTARFSAGFEVSFEGETFAGVSASGAITGPGPIVIEAELRIEILFLEISWNETFTLGSGDGNIGPQVDDLLDRIAGELRVDNLEARGGEDPRVVPAERQQLGGRTLLTPRGSLVLRQRRVPLGLPLDRVEGVPLRRRSEGAVAATGARPEPPKDWFAPAAYLEPRTEGEEINQPHFERMPAGVEVGFGEDEAGAPTACALGFEEFYKPALVAGSLLVALPRGRLLAAARGARDAAVVRDRSPLVRVRDEEWVVHGAPGVAATSQTHAHVLARDTPGSFALAGGDKPVAWSS